MPTLLHLLTLLAFLYILILNQTCHHKATITATVVWMCPVNFKIFKNYFCCRGRQNYFPDENIPLSLNSFCVSGS